MIWFQQQFCLTPVNFWCPKIKLWLFSSISDNHLHLFCKLIGGVDSIVGEVVLKLLII